MTGGARRVNDQTDIRRCAGRVSRYGDGAPEGRSVLIRRRAPASPGMSRQTDRPPSVPVPGAWHLPASRPAWRRRAKSRIGATAAVLCGSAQSRLPKSVWTGAAGPGRERHGPGGQRSRARCRVICSLQRNCNFVQAF